ncbi:MAG: hypothetical protein HYS17_10525 [Micavibrio aeruginosavorus]|uniref:Uncharacterized protein n=1 Tax=Micavibrio aeruginosavorus TaxID=349221 RepID=A0A7T5R1W1_9BACT|nr:MAG: hypothetical protein HYS17_10525 [Micavibrio aeruginosavorus]
MTDDNKIISIFRGVASMQKQLGILEAALGQNDELTVYEQMELLARRQRPTIPLCQALQTALLTVESWKNPYVTLNAARRLIENQPQGHAYAETALPFYIRAAEELGTESPLLGFHSLRFALIYCQTDSANELLAFNATERLCLTSNPVAALNMVNHFIELRRTWPADNPLRPRLVGMICALAATIGPHAPEEALDAYASLFRDIRHEGGERLAAYIEAVAPLALRVGAQAPTEAAVCLSEILDCLEPAHPLYAAAQDYKARFEARLNPGDYQGQSPVAPADFLKHNRPQPS